MCLGVGGIGVVHFRTAQTEKLEHYTAYFPFTILSVFIGFYSNAHRIVRLYSVLASGERSQ